MKIDIESFAYTYRLKVRLSSHGKRIIPGKHGHIYEYSSDLMGVLVMPKPPRSRYWGHARTALREAGMTVVQDGDGEGAAIFDPTDPAACAAAIKAAGIKRKRKVSPERRQELITPLSRPVEGHIQPQERRSDQR